MNLVKGNFNSTGLNAKIQEVFNDWKVVNTNGFYTAVGTILENDNVQVLDKYWSLISYWVPDSKTLKILGKTKDDYPNYDAISKSGLLWNYNTAWSAVTITYIVKTYSNSEISITFPQAAGHKVYADLGKKNRINKTKGWTLYSLDPAAVTKPIIEIGDILINPRDDSYVASHGDLVYSKTNTQFTVIGGNLKSATTVATRTLNLNPDGTFPDTYNSQKDPYLLLLKYMG